MIHESRLRIDRATRRIVAIRSVPSRRRSSGGQVMNGRWCMGALALGIALLGGSSDARAQIVDMGKYPNIAGGWGRSEVFQWSRGEKPPLTPEYQAVYEANLAARREGGHGTDVMYRCFPPGMPRQMHVYSPMEIVITPNV